MNEGQIGTQIETLSKAARMLMSLTTTPEKRLAGAMAELGFTFLENPPFSAVTSRHATRLRSLFSGEGTWEEIARRLDATRLEEAADSFWRLYTATMHAFYKEMTSDPE